MTEPTVGVVIPAYQAERFVGEAIRSVLNQGCPVAEVIVCDDGSTDATGAVAAAIGPPVRVVRRANGGIGAARNTALDHVTAELIAFLDADDLWTHASLTSRLAHFTDPAVDAVFGQVAQFTGPAPDSRSAGPLLPAHLPAGMVVRREAFDRVGRFAEGQAVSEGLDWMLRAGEAGLHTVTVDDQVMWRRVHGANNSLTNRAEIGEFARTLKASLDRRRAAGQDAA